MSFIGLTFQFAFGIGCLLALVRHPIYGLLTYVGVFYLHPPSRWWGEGLFIDLRWSLATAGVTLISLVIHSKSASTISLRRSPMLWGMVLFVAWAAIQSVWALDSEAHWAYVTFLAKFIIVVFMICKCIQNEWHLKLFLWTHVLGCFYFGWLAYTKAGGGRFEGFGGPGLGEANAGALQLVTGIAVAGSLLLAGKVRARLAILGMIPFMVNALVATISRGGFLSAAAAGIIFNIWTPKIYRRRVMVLSAMAVVLFALLTNPIYWQRIETIQYKGQEIEGRDTGSGRLVIIEKQWQMSRAHPLGCGHTCTAVLSPSYMDASMLSGGARASHNSFMSMLVDHGIPGAIFYFAMCGWIVRNIRVLAARLRDENGVIATVFPAVAAVLGAIIIGDMFVQYMKFETRFWFIALLMVLLHLTRDRKQDAPGGAVRPSSDGFPDRRLLKRSDGSI